MKDSITNLLNNTGYEIRNALFESEFPFSEYNSRHKGAKFINDLYKLNYDLIHVDSFGGEGEGDSYWSIFKFTHEKEEVYVKFNGFYQSYTGAEFDGWYFVEPAEVTVTQWNRV
jgi:hypothetical protein